MKSKIALFFTRNISLEDWVNSGLISREKLIYEEYIKNNLMSQVLWFTYGLKDNLIADSLSKEGKLNKFILVIPMPSFFKFVPFKSFFYSILLPFIHFNKLKQCNILKTNQMDGVLPALISKFLLKKKIIIRTGYIITELLKISDKSLFSYLKLKIFALLEKLSYGYADVVIVSSNNSKKYIHNHYKIDIKKIEVLYTYIDLKIFKSMNKKRFSNRLLYVGRLHHDKNLFELFDAVKISNLVLDIYGTGLLENDLKRYAALHKIKVNFKGIIDNNNLPKIYNRYKFFILCSASEGLPKVLIEAMACGCVCIGTNVNGINELLSNNRGIFIDKTDSASISFAIKKALITNNYDKIKENSISFIKKISSVKDYYKKEEYIIEKLSSSII